MADRMSAEIWIGGQLPHSLLKEFPISDLRLDWDATPFDASSEEGILSARDESGLLHFADCEIAWGEFQELEGWLREHNIPFRRHRICYGSRRQLNRRHHNSLFHRPDDPHGPRQRRRRPQLQQPGAILRRLRARTAVLTHPHHSLNCRLEHKKL